MIDADTKTADCTLTCAYTEAVAVYEGVEEDRFVVSDFEN